MSVKRSSAEQGSDRLAVRRRQSRHRAAIALLVLALLLVAGAWWGTWQSSLRVSHVTIFGSEQSLALLAQAEMSGTYLYLFPRNSIFFIPEHGIREKILASDSSIGSVSIFREGFTGLSIKINERTPVARWCGVARVVLATSTPSGCYLFDASGYIFNTATNTDHVLAPFSLYAPLVNGVAEPLLATIADASALPALFDFARQASTFGAPVSAIVIRGDEVDDYVATSTRITYVIGHEQDAFAALTSAKSNLNLSDGSISYIDLRFPGKVYLKKKE